MVYNMGEGAIKLSPEMGFDAYLYDNYNQINW